MGAIVGLLGAGVGATVGTSRWFHVGVGAGDGTTTGLPVGTDVVGLAVGTENATLTARTARLDVSATYSAPHPPAGRMATPYGLDNNALVAAPPLPDEPEKLT